MAQSSQLWKNIGVWKGNRPCDSQKIEEIIKSGKIDGMIYVAELVVDRGNIQYVCYDGWHRVQAMRAMNNRPVFVHVMRQASEKDIEKHFKQLNSATPIPEIYKDENTIYTNHKKAVILQCLDEIQKKWPSLKKPTSRPQKPHYNRDQLFAILEELEFTDDITGTRLFEKLLHLNKKLRKLETHVTLSKTCIDKCLYYDCFILAYKEQIPRFIHLHDQKMMEKKKKKMVDDEE